MLTGAVPLMVAKAFTDEELRRSTEPGQTPYAGSRMGDHTGSADIAVYYTL